MFRRKNQLTGLLLYTSSLHRLLMFNIDITFYPDI
jgi:hypothetical protein